MASGGWVTELDKKEHKNWVMVGCALNVAKNGISPKIQKEMETWYQSLVSSPPLQSLVPCACAPRGPKCATCITWESELKRHHASTRPKICWDNSDRKQWGSPTGAWEVAKVFMPALGSRKAHVINAETTDIGGLLNLLEWCPFIKPPVNRKLLSSARDECRNHWAHAPKQELQDADVPTIFGHLNNLLNDPVFSTDKAAQKASKDLQDLFHQGLVNVRNSEVEALHLLRQSLEADLSKCQEDLAEVHDKVGEIDVETKKVNSGFQKDLSEVKEQSGLNREEIDKLRQQLETKLKDVKTNLSSEISTILRAVDDFNRRLSERDDLREAFEVIREDVEDVRNGIQHVVMELNSTTSQVGKLKIDLANVHGEVASNKSTISGLQTDLNDVKEEVETLKWNSSQENNDDDDIQCTAPQRLNAFTGRTSALEWLEMNIVLESRENGPGTSCNTKTICGLGGCGKTSLAVEFAWRYANCFPGGVFWINGESDENVRKSVVEIFAIVNIPSSTTENIDDTLNRFLAWLSKKNLPWLLVVDNADDLQDSTCPTGVTKICRGPWQRTGSALKHGHILLTTRQNAKNTKTFLKLSRDDCFELQCLSEEEGARFLMKRAGLEGDSVDPDAIRLAKELGALPLALEQAAAYIGASPLELRFKDYLEKYLAVKLRILKQQPAVAHSLEAKHRLSVHTTWEMNFEYVKEKSAAAATMMRIAAFLESENIPIVVINPGSPELDQMELRNSFNEIDIAAILKVLSSYSLFSVDNQNRVFGVHKLVQEVVRESLTPAERTEALVAGIRVLSFAFGKCVVYPAKYSHLDVLSDMNEEDANIVFSLLLSFRKLKNHMEEEMKMSGEDYVEALLNEDTLDLCDFAYHLIRNNISLFRITTELADFRLKVSEIVQGDQDPNVLLLRMLSTSISKRNCSTPENYNEAKKLSENTVKKLNELEKTGAAIDPNVKYRVLRFRASFYTLEKQWEKNYNALLELEGLPLNDASIVDLQMSIANAENYVSACNFQRALKRYKNALQLARKIYSKDHPELLRLLQHIAMLFSNEGKLQEAKAYAEEMIEICKNIPHTCDWYIKGMESALSVMSKLDPKGSEIILLEILKERWPKMYSFAKDGYIDNCEPIVDDGSDEHLALVLGCVMKCLYVVFKMGAAYKISTDKLNFYRRIGEMLVSCKKKFYGDIHSGMIGAYNYLILVLTLLGTDHEEVSRLLGLTAKCTQGESNQIYQGPPCDYNVYNAREYKDQGNTFFKSGDYTSALDAYNKALYVSPNDGKLLTNRAAAYVKLSEQHEQSQVNKQRKLLKCALKDADDAITADPAWMKGYYWKAVCLAKLGKRGPSLAAAAVAEYWFPSQCTQIPAVVDHFGRYNVRVVNTVENLIHATERTDSNAVVLLKEGKYELPKPLKPPDNTVMVGLGTVQITCTKGDPLQLDTTVYIENIRLSPTIESTTKLKEKAKECLNRGQLDMALSLYSEALTACPSDAQLLTTRATTYLKLAEQKKGTLSERKSMLELALKDSEAAIRADSTWLLGYYNKAVSLAELDRKHQALAAAATFKHLSSGRDIPGVTHRYGGLQIHIVENSRKLHCVLQCFKEREGVNQVVLMKEGEYLLEKSAEIAQPIVVVGQGKVTVSCKTGRPFHFTQEHYVENVELRASCDSQPELQDCASSDDTHAEVISLATPSGYEHTDIDPECKVS